MKAKRRSQIEAQVKYLPLGAFNALDYVSLVFKFTYFSSPRHKADCQRQSGRSANEAHNKVRHTLAAVAACRLDFHDFIPVKQGLVELALLRVPANNCMYNFTRGSRCLQRSHTADHAR